LLLFFAVDEPFVGLYFIFFIAEDDLFDFDVAVIMAIWPVLVLEVIPIRC
jgi:hypothetical protein